MEKQLGSILQLLCNILLLICFSCMIKVGGDVHGSRQHKKHHRHHHGGAFKLFVFGDSYADTGNWDKSAASWKQPYGSTFPGQPAGRFSDGRVLTDYIASYLGIKSPVPYTLRENYSKRRQKLGMNFAFGGTGVYDTYVREPNMTTQIDYFQQLLQQKVYNKEDLTNSSSIALVSLAGNDYGTYMSKHGKLDQDFPAFVTSVIHQLSINIKRIHEMGVQKLAITALLPMGCLPQLASSSSYQNCSKDVNDISNFHNQLLHQSVRGLNNQTSSKKQVFVILDLYSAFTSAFDKAQYHTGGLKVKKNPLEPCCVGVTRSHSCGDTDNKSGEKKYVVCNDPNSSIFWDLVHPSHNGWHSAFLALNSSLLHLLH